MIFYFFFFYNSKISSFYFCLFFTLLDSFWGHLKKNSQQKGCSLNWVNIHMCHSLIIENSHMHLAKKQWYIQPKNYLFKIKEEDNN